MPSDGAQTLHKPRSACWCSVCDTYALLILKRLSWLQKKNAQATYLVQRKLLNCVFGFTVQDTSRLIFDFLALISFLKIITKNRRLTLVRTLSLNQEIKSIHQISALSQSTLACTDCVSYCATVPLRQLFLNFIRNLKRNSFRPTVT